MDTGTIALGIIAPLCVVAAPILAIRIEKHIEEKRTRRQRKIYIFHTLMATRAARVSPRHVEALNMISLEFYDQRTVVEAWKEYHDQLKIKYQDENFPSWAGKCEELLTELLYRMAESLGYHFDKVELKKGCYTPEAHFLAEQENNVIRRYVVELISGKRSIPMSVISFPANTEEKLSKQRELQQKLKELLQGERPIKVKIENE